MRSNVVFAISFLIAASAQAQSAGGVDVRHVLASAVRVDVIDGRFLSVRIDSVPPAAEGAVLINRYRRIFDYLVVHQIPGERLFNGVGPTSDNRHLTLIDNLLGDAAAARTLADYLATFGTATNVAGGPPGNRITVSRTAVREVDVLTIAARFFHPVVVNGKSIVFYRCAGINGIEELGAARKPEVEAFAFWALAPAFFDADSSLAASHALNHDFGAAKKAFQTVVENANYAPEVIAKAKADFYATMSTSGALRSILRTAYTDLSRQLPIRVDSWDGGSR